MRKRITNRFLALATDYDGTLATGGSVEANTITALMRLLRSGRVLVLVTGRELPDLKSVFARLDLFDRVVAENGALIYRPQTGDEELLCAPGNQILIERLQELRVPFSAGKAVVATTDEYEQTVRGVIHELRLDLDITMNKGSIMILPKGVNKHSGLIRALSELSLVADDVVAIGDAENDCPLLASCGFGVAVANALPELKSRADLVTIGAHGVGVIEIIDHLLFDDLASVRSGGARTQ